MSLFDLAHVVKSLSSETVTFSRYAAGTYDSNGYAVAKTLSKTFTAWASVQPTSGTDLEKVPEGDGPSDFITVFVARQPSQEILVQDFVTTRKGVYEVFHVRHWGDSGNWWKAVARKKDVSE